MNRRTRSRLFAVTLVTAVLSLYLVWSMRVRPRSRENRNQADVLSRVIHTDEDRIARVLIERRDANMQFVVIGTHWQMRSPVRDLARQSAVIQLVHAIVSARIARRFDPAGPGNSDVAGNPYGLSPPEATVSLADSAGDETLVLHIGTLTPGGANAYAQIDGTREVALIPTDVRRYALAAVEDFRSRRIVTFDRSVVSRFRVSSPGASRDWSRTTHGWHTVEGSDTIDGDSRAVEGLLRRLRGLRARRFYDGGDAREQTSRSPYRVRITRLPPAPAIDLHVEFSGDGLARTYVDGEFRVVEIDSASVMPVFSTPFIELRDRRLIRLDGSQPATLRMAWPDTTVTLLRDGANWRFANAAWEPPNPARAQALVRTLGALRFDGVDDEKRISPGARPSLRVEFRDKLGRLLSEARVYRGDHKVFASSRHVRGTLRLADDPIPRLRRLVRHLREATP